MKKNAALFILLAGLLGFTYFYEELGTQQQKIEFDEKHQIVKIDYEKLDSIILSKTKLLKIAGNWVVGEFDYPASSGLIKKLLNHLNSIHKVKLLLKDEDQYFSNQSHYITLSGQGKNWKYRLGDVSEVTGNFYFQDLNGPDRKTYLARDISEFSGFYKTELELFLGKYLDLKDLIAGAPGKFINGNLFKNFLSKKVNSVKVDNKWNRWFEVRFSDKETEPPVPKGLEYKSFEKTLSDFISMAKIKRLVSKGNNKLVLDLCELTVTGEDDQETFKAYGSMNGDKGIFVTSDRSPSWIFEMDPKSRDIFFSNVQKFWNKKIFPQSALASIRGFKFKLGDEQAMYNFEIEDIKTFKITSNDQSVKSIAIGNMNFLFNLLFSLTKFGQAKQVLFELPKDKSPRFSLNMELLDKMLKIHFYDAKVLVENKTDGFSLEYMFPVIDYNYKSLHDFFALK